MPYVVTFVAHNILEMLDFMPLEMLDFMPLEMSLEIILKWLRLALIY